MDAPPVIITPARRPRSRFRILAVVLGLLGVLVCILAGWRQGVEREHFQTMLASVAADEFRGISITRADSVSTDIRDAASSTEFISALRELVRYSPNHPQYRREKELSVTFSLRDGREFTFRVCFSVDQQDQTAYIYAPWGTYKGGLLYEFFRKHDLV